MVVHTTLVTSLGAITLGVIILGEDLITLATMETLIMDGTTIVADPGSEIMAGVETMVGMVTTHMATVISTEIIIITTLSMDTMVLELEEVQAVAQKEEQMALDLLTVVQEVE